METSSYIESHVLHIAFPFWKLEPQPYSLFTELSLYLLITEVCHYRLSAEFQAKKQSYFWTFVAAEVK